MSGTNYHISVKEIKESEKKLKLISILHFISASTGKISLIDFISQCSESVDTSVASREDNVKSELLNCFSLCEDIDLNEAQTKSLIFIAGYAGCQVERRTVACDMCKKELI